MIVRINRELAKIKSAPIKDVEFWINNNNYLTDGVRYIQAMYEDLNSMSDIGIQYFVCVTTEDKLTVGDYITAIEELLIKLNK